MTCSVTFAVTGFSGFPYKNLSQNCIFLSNSPSRLTLLLNPVCLSLCLAKSGNFFLLSLSSFYTIELLRLYTFYFYVKVLKMFLVSKILSRSSLLDSNIGHYRTVQRLKKACIKKFECSITYQFTSRIL